MKPIIPLTLGVLALVGCERSPSVVQPQARPTAIIQPTGHILTYDDELAAVDNTLPGFAGIYIDSAGSLVAALTDLSQSEAAIPAVAQLLENVVLPGPAWATTRATMLRHMRVAKAAYTFQQLRIWYAYVTRDILPAAGVTMGDIDEVRNRIVVGIENAALEASIAAKLAGLPIPAGVVEVETVAPAEITSTTLQNYVRPVVGGLQVGFLQGGSQYLCTLTYNIAHRFVNGGLDPAEYFLTCSHCTDAFGQNTGMAMGQPTIDYPIGTEYADPPLFTSSHDSRCPANRQCRYSDAALFKYNGSSYLQGYAAWPPNNSITFTDEKTITGAGDPIVGLTVYKVGRTTGRTGGAVTRTCADYPQYDNGTDTGRSMLCQSQANLAVERGDSGSPVFWLFGDGTLDSVGILWGGAAGYGVFSTANDWNQELRAVVGGGLGETITP
jgi:Trypsin